MVRLGWPCLGLLAGCYVAPDLPLIDEVPIEGPDFIPCADDLEDQRITYVVDGDTFDYAALAGGEEERVRLLGIDAPEVSTPVECYGPEAQDWLRNTIEAELVTLTFDSTCTDVYDRTLAYVWARGDLYYELTRDRRLEDLTDTVFGDEDPALLINEAILRLGVAVQYPEEIAGTLYYQQRLDAAQASAEADQLGLYTACP